MQPPIALKKPYLRKFFEIELKDDYSWLREKENPAVLEYLEAENAYTEAVMEHTKKFQDELYEEMLGRIKEDDSSVPFRKGNYWYYTRTEEGKAYAIHCRKKGDLSAEEEVILDENRLAEGLDFFDLGDFEISTNENLVAYTIDNDGSEYYTLYFKDLQTGIVSEEHIDRVHSDIEWANDNRTVFYVRLEDGTHRPYQLFKYELGNKNSEKLVFHEDDDAFFLGVGKSKDEKYLFIDLGSAITSEVHYIPADDPGQTPEIILPRMKSIEYGVDHHKGWWYITTNDNALNFRLVRTRVGRHSPTDWEEVIAHDPSAKIDGIDTFEDFIVVFGRKGGLKNIQVRNIDTAENYDISFPEAVYTIWPGANAEFATDILRFNYSSLTTPTTVFDFNMQSKVRVQKKQVEILGHFDPEEYVSERIFATAEDGVKVPISIVYKKSLRENGPQPFFLYAYGSYGTNIEPYFSTNRLSLLDRGLIFGIAHIRGGGEMGRYWYEEGKFLNKKNTFADFIACAEHVIEEGFTSKEELVVSGGSAGGLLMGAVTNMRPDLFRAVVAHVPFVDVMNTMLDPSIPLTVIEYDEWGNPNEEVFFRYMHSYSPYDNVVHAQYPAMLVTAGLNDPRVHYWEPAKWVAKIRQHKLDDNILLLKTNMGAGHQGASGRYGHLKEVAFDYAFVLEILRKVE